MIERDECCWKKKTQSRLRESGVQGRGEGVWVGQSAIFNRLVRTSLKKVTCDQRLEGSGRVSHPDIWGRNIPEGLREQLEQGCRVVACQACLRGSKGVRVQQLEQSEEKGGWRWGQRPGIQFTLDPVGPCKHSAFPSRNRASLGRISSDGRHDLVNLFK